MTYSQMGLERDAVDQFERYLELAPGARDRGEVREWVAALKSEMK